MPTLQKETRESECTITFFKLTKLDHNLETRIKQNNMFNLNEH